MKYILIRIALMTAAVIAIYYVSNYIAANAEPEVGYMEGAIAFFRMTLAVAIIGLSVFTYEAYRFNRQHKIKERNHSLVLMVLMVLLLIVFGGYFFEFV